MQTSIWNWSDAAAPPAPEDRSWEAPEPVLEVMDVESATDSAVNGIQSIAEILDQVRRDCSDRSELP